MFIAPRARIRATLLGLSSLALIMTMAACAPNNSQHLPDDTTTEHTPVGGAPSTMPTKTIDLAPLDPTNSDASAILAKYSSVDPDHLIPRNLLAAALTYYDANLATIANKNYLSVIDFSLPSTKRRFFIINMASGSVFATTMAHGRGSDANNDGYADKFSNTENSLMSSLGIYMTAETYIGDNGLSLRLDGLSSTNSNVRMRSVVVHGAAYVQDKEVIQGRSWGCPAVPMAYRDRVIGWLKGGSVIYANLSTSTAAVN